MTLGERWRQRQSAWIARRHPRCAVFTSNRHSLYILPNRIGVTLFFFLIFIFVLAINYQNALVFGIFFWILSLTILNLYYTHHNLSGVSVRCVSSRNAAVGESVEFVIEVTRSNARARHAIDVSLEGGAVLQRVDLDEAPSQTLTLSLLVERRGFVVIPRINLRSVYPLGIARTWSYAYLSHYALAWPQPVDADILAQTDGVVAGGSSTHSVPGVSDFDALRHYVPGDRISRVHWPASSRGGALQVKHFVDPVAQDEWIRWDDYKVLPVEKRLQYMVFLVEKMAQAGLSYGLLLPGEQLPADKGEAHKNRCLIALGAYGQQEPHFA